MTETTYRVRQPFTTLELGTTMERTHAVQLETGERFSTQLGAVFETVRPGGQGAVFPETAAGELTVVHWPEQKPEHGVVLGTATTVAEGAAMLFTHHQQ